MEYPISDTYNRISCSRERGIELMYLHKLSLKGDFEMAKGLVIHSA